MRLLTFESLFSMTTSAATPLTLRTDSAVRAAKGRWPAILPPAEWMALTLSSRGVRALCAAEPIAFPLPIAGGEATLSAAAAGRATVLI